MSELADVQRRVAELRADPCAACDGKGNRGVPDFEQDKKAVTMSACGSCHGSGKVRPLQKPCPCLAVKERDGINDDLDMDGCRLCYKRQAHRPECNNCHGTGWVPNTDPWAFIKAMGFAESAKELEEAVWRAALKVMEGKP